MTDQQGNPGEPGAGQGPPPNQGPPPYQGPPYGQPSHGDHDGPPNFAPGTGFTPGVYPQQQLLPHEVQHGTNRTPIYIGVAIVLALIVAGGAAFFLLRGENDDNRAEYCAELRDVTDDGDLSSALSGADPSMFDRLLAIGDIAPDAVADDWSAITKFIDDASGATPDLASAIEAFNALQVIANDAEANCDLTLEIPSL